MFLSHHGDIFEIIIRSFHFLEIIIMLEQFLCQRESQYDEMKLVKRHTEAIFKLYKDTVNRKTGMQDNLIKIHLIHYMIDNIENLGLPISFDIAPGKNCHIAAVKIPVLRIQHQEDSLYAQV